MRNLARVSCVACLTLVCRSSRLENAESGETDPGPLIRHSGALVDRRAILRAPGLGHLPVGVAAPFAPRRRPNPPGVDVQVNDPSRDRYYDFSAATNPEVFFGSIQSEASLAISGPHVVVTYNTTAGATWVLDSTGTVVLTSALAVGFSASADGGRTFSSGLFPPLPGAVETYFDNAVDVDRDGRFYAAYLSTVAPAGSGIAVSRSDDGGLTWDAPVPASLESGVDKPWLAVGPDPAFPGQDVVYVTWTVVKARSTELHMARSRDGGRTFGPPSPLFVPAVSATTGLGSAASFSTPFVDPVSGRLYVAFAQSTRSSAWAVRLAASDDAGGTFFLMRPDIPGAPAPDFIPAIQPGHEVDCGEIGSLTALHAGPDLRPSGSSVPRYRQAWWIGDQPFVAAQGGLVALAWASSTSAVPLDPASGSRVFLIVSRDRGATWSAPRVVHPERPEDVQHVVPAVAIDPATRDIHVSYAVQHADETLDTELATLREADGYTAFQTTRLSSRPSTIPPSNLSLSDAKTSNYDAVSPCYSLGHYMHLRAADGIAYAVWNDARNTVTHPVNAHDPLSGQTHSQPDVFFRAVRP